MNKAEVKAKIISMPIERPYCDWSFLTGIDDPYTRYAAANKIIDKTSDQYGRNGLDENHIPEIEIARCKSVQVIKGILNERKIKDTDVTTELEIAKGTLTRMWKCQTIQIPIEKLGYFCTRILKVSVEDIMFGGTKDLILPKYYSLAVRELRKLSKIDKEEIKSAIRSLNNKNAADGRFNRDKFRKIIINRFQQIKDEKGVSNTRILYPEGTHPQIGTHLSRLCDQESEYIPHINFFMFYSISSGIPLDYLMNDCIELKYLNVKYREKDGSVQSLDNGDEFQIIESCLRMNQEDSNTVVSAILSKSV